MIVQEVFGFVKRDGPGEVVRSEAEAARRGLGVQGKGAAAPLPLHPRCRRDEWVSLIILSWTDWVRVGLLSPAMSKYRGSKISPEALPMTLDVLETDSQGSVVEKPVVGWMVTTDQGVTVVAAFEYKDFASEVEQHRAKIQLGLTPQQALRLANALTDVARDILRGPSETQGSP